MIHFSSTKIQVLHEFDVCLQVSVFLSVLGLTVLPSSAVVGNFISNIYEDRSGLHSVSMIMRMNFLQGDQTNTSILFYMELLY